MYSAIFFLTGLLLIGSLSTVQCRFYGTGNLHETLLDKRYYNRNAHHEKRHHHALEDTVLNFLKRRIRLDNEAELREAQAALFNVNSQSGWLLLNYVGPSTVHFAAGGEGGVDEIKQYLEDDQIQYGLVRLGGIQEKGSLKVKIRDVFFVWIGPGVGIIEKGKKMGFLGDVQAFLQPFHADVTVLNKNNFNYETVLDRSHPLSGSHVID